MKLVGTIFLAGLLARISRAHINIQGGLLMLPNYRQCLCVVIQLLVLSLVLVHTASAQTVKFDFRARPVPMGLTPAVVDVNKDGWLEVFGTLNNTSGQLLWMDQASLGLQKLTADGRANRSIAVADFNGDGYLDLVSNTYACNGDTSSQALLFINNGDGTFTEDPSFAQLPNIRGFGETIVVADFDNDGNLDIFLPFYTRPDVLSPQAPPGQPSNPNGWDCRPYNGGTRSTPPQPPSFVPSSYLLRNNGPFAVTDGQHHFTDITTSAGVSLQDLAHLSMTPEGAQAIDINEDGYVDLYAGGHLFINNGNLTFTDVSASKGLRNPNGSYLCDEGAKFLDWNNDGKLDLVLMDAGCPTTGPRLFQFNGTSWTTGTFTEMTSLLPSGLTYNANYGLNVYDLDNDGGEDIVIVGGANLQPRIFVNTNTPTGFILGSSVALDGLGNGNSGPAFGDLNRDGRIDLLYSHNLVYFENNTVLPATNGSFTIEMLGPEGQQNQQGHVVKVYPPSSPMILTRVVDGGSGYMAQNQYPLLIGTPFAGIHTVEALYAPTAVCGSPCKVRFTILPGQYAKVYGPSADFPNGYAQVMDAPLGTPADEVKWLAPLITNIINGE
jgi:hypothetical protein